MESKQTIYFFVCKNQFEATFQLHCGLETFCRDLWTKRFNFFILNSFIFEFDIPIFIISTLTQTKNEKEY